MAKKEVGKKERPLNEKYYMDLKSGTLSCTTDTDCMQKYGGDGSPEPVKAKASLKKRDMKRK